MAAAAPTLKARDGRQLNYGRTNARKVADGYYLLFTVTLKSPCPDAASVHPLTVTE